MSPKSFEIERVFVPCRATDQQTRCQVVGERIGMWIDVALYLALLSSKIERAPGQ